MRNADNYKYVDLVVANGVTLYDGALCAVVAASGELTPCADSTTLRFAGVAIGEGGDRKVCVGNGTRRCRIIYADAEILVPCAATVTGADVLTELYTVDDDSVTDVATLGPVAGLMTEVESSGVTCWLAIRAKAMPLGT